MDQSLGASEVEPLVRSAEERLESSGKRALHVDWYGGEPLLNQPFLEKASLALQDLCRRRGAGYVASVVSNGTRWPADAEDFVRRHRIAQVQLSLDGLPEHHNRRRRKLNPDSEPPESTFDATTRLIERLLDFVHVDIRINLDEANQDDLLPLVAWMQSRGWFQRKFPAIVQPARISSYSERSKFLERSQLTLADFDRLRGTLRTTVRGTVIGVQEGEVPDGFPYPRTSVCAALAQDSTVIGADGNEYRCALQVSEPDRAVAFGPPHARSSGKDAAWWEGFDPTNQPTCSVCSFLPICWGGCPKKHLEGDRRALDEQSDYWRRNLARLVAEGTGAAIPSTYVIPIEQQFRDGRPELPLGLSKTSFQV